MGEGNTCYFSWLGGLIKWRSIYKVNPLIYIQRSINFEYYCYAS